jgi:hypothetical protein
VCVRAPVADWGFFSLAFDFLYPLFFYSMCLFLFVWDLLEVFWVFCHPGVFVCVSLYLCVRVFVCVVLFPLFHSYMMSLQLRDPMLLLFLFCSFVQKRFQNDMSINNAHVDVLQGQCWESTPWKWPQVGDIVWS